MARSRRNRDEDSNTEVKEPAPAELLEEGGPITASKVASPAPAPAPAARKSSSSRVTDKPILRRRQAAADGTVPLRTFVRAVETKDDQLAGFVAWCAKNGHAKHSMKEWRGVLENFQTTPVGN